MLYRPVPGERRGAGADGHDDRERPRWAVNRRRSEETPVVKKSLVILIALTGACGSPHGNPEVKPGQTATSVKPGQTATSTTMFPAGGNGRATSTTGPVADAPGTPGTTGAQPITTTGGQGNTTTTTTRGQVNTAATTAKAATTTTTRPPTTTTPAPSSGSQ